MRIPSPVALVAALAWLLPVPSAPKPPADDRAAAVLSELGSSIPAWEQALTNIVAEERYTQDRLVYSTRVQRRELMSDLLLVRTEETGRLVPFRDVFEVDGHPVRDRTDRLAKLFIHPTPEALAQARAIVSDGARFNLGAERNVNVPLLPLAFLEPASQPRFAFSGSPAGAGTWRLKFREVSRPTLVRGAGGKDAPVSGTFEIDLATHAVRKSEWALADPPTRLTVTVVFSLEPRLKIVVPVEMREDLSDGRWRLLGHAVYRNYRRFEVQVIEQAK